MASEISKLFVSIGANLGDFNAGISKVKSDMSGLGSTIMNHNKAIGGSMMAVGGSIVAAGAASVKSTAELGDTLGKMAKRTGFSVEALAELKHAAELSGTDLNALEKGMRGMTNVVQDANDGLETYTRAFDRIGVDYKALADMKPEDQFNTVMEALAGVEDETTQMATAMDIFGARVGTAVLPMLVNGTEGLDEMRAEAHELGLVMSEDQVAAAEDMKDAMLRLEGSITSISMVIADVLMPAIQPVIDIMTVVITKIRGWMDASQPLKVAIIGVTAVLGALLIPLGAAIFFLPQLIALHNTHAISLIAGKIAIIAHTIATTAATVATTAFGVAITIATGPIGLIIAAIVGLIAIAILLWKNWDKIVSFFKTTVVNAFKWVWNFLKEWGLLILGIIFPPALVAGAIMKWKDEIVGALSKVWGAIVAGAKMPINAIIGLFNKALGFFSGRHLFSISIPSWVPSIGGKGFSLDLPTLPTIPSLKYGGIVPGPIGEPVPIIAHGGERFLGMGGMLPAGAGAPITVNISSGVFMGSESEAETFGYKVRDIINRINRRDGIG